MNNAVQNMDNSAKEQPMNIESVSVENFYKGELFGDVVDGTVDIKQLPFFSAVESTEGRYSIRLADGPTFSTGKNGFFLAPANVTQTITHHTDPETGNMRARWVFFNLRINEVYQFDRICSLPVVPDEEVCLKLHDILDQIFKETDALLINSLILRLSSVLMQAGSIRKTEKNENLYEVLYFMRENYRNDLRIPDLAKIACLSESGFYAKFKNEFSASPLQYLNNLRLSQSTVLLRRTDMQIAEISRQVGFDDPLYFSRLFKRKFHLSPKDYRKNSL